MVELNAEQQALVEKYRKRYEIPDKIRVRGPNRKKVDPLEMWATFKAAPWLFVEKGLGVKPTEQQREALEAIAKAGAKVAVRSGHNTGKTTVTAWIILWFVMFFYDCKIPCTAPGASQLRDVLWPEVRRWRDKLPEGLREQVEITQDRVFIKGGKDVNFAVARTARKEKPEALQGFHAKNMLFVIDEASGVEEQVFEVARSVLSSPGARIVMAANPTRSAGFFYDAFHRHRDSWTTLHWSCLDSPLPAANYAEEVAADYGEESNYYRVRVLGDFPLAEFDQFISLELLESAVGREGVIGEGPVVWGLDPAWMGDNETALAKRKGDTIYPIEGVTGYDTMQVVGWVTHQYEAAPEKPDLIVVDSIGIGAGVYDRLRQLRYPVVACNVAEAPAARREYANLRAELWDAFKKWLVDRRGSLPADQKLLGQASVIKYDLESGKLRMERKADMRARGVKSPDRADAVCLTFYHQPRKEARPKPKGRPWTGYSMGRG